MTIFSTIAAMIIAGIFVWFYRDYREDIRVSSIKDDIDDTYHKLVKVRNDLSHARSYNRQLCRDIGAFKSELAQTKLELAQLKKNINNSYHAGDM